MVNRQQTIFYLSKILTFENIEFSNKSQHIGLFATFFITLFFIVKSSATLTQSSCDRYRPKGLLFHSDQGCHYTSKEFQRELA